MTADGGAMATMEHTMQKIELRVSDIIHLENSIRELHTRILTTAEYVDIHVRTYNTNVTRKLRASYRLVTRKSGVSPACYEEVTRKLATFRPSRHVEMV